jgi:hypothetical protein
VACILTRNTDPISSRAEAVAAPFLEAVYLRGGTSGGARTNSRCQKLVKLYLKVYRLNRFEDVEYFDESALRPVGMLRKVAKEFRALDARDRAGIVRLVTIYSKGDSNLNVKQLHSQGRFKAKGSNAEFLIFAFKDFQVRLYGAEIDGQFIITEFEKKKKDGADRAQLQRTADKLAALKRVK